MLAGTGIVTSAATPTVASAEGQPLAANVERLCETLEYFGAPLPPETRPALARAGQARAAQELQELIDPRVLLVVHLNPEAR